jgi:MoxR-like ATPase
VQGWLLPIGTNGAFSYVPAEFVTLWEEGNSLFTFDELDAFDPNMLIVVNGALAGGELHIPQRFQNPHVQRGVNAGVIATANTFGTGADILYAGRNQLDAATLDRFYPIVMDYDQEFEAQVAGQQKVILDWCWRMREKVNTLKLRRVISTRTIIKAVTASKAGIQWDEVKRDLLTGWTRDELAKTGELQS